MSIDPVKWAIAYDTLRTVCMKRNQEWKLSEDEAEEEKLNLYRNTDYPSLKLTNFNLKMISIILTEFSKKYYR